MNDLKKTEIDQRQEADMLAEGGGVLSPAVPTVEAEDEGDSSPEERASLFGTGKTIAAQARDKVTEKFREYAQRSLGQLSRFTDVPTRKAAVAQRAERSAKQAMLTLSLLEDFRSGKYRKISWPSAAVLGGSILYLFNPNDVIPDVIPLVGKLDDAVVMQLCALVLRKDLVNYCEFKGYPVSDYFGPFVQSDTKHDGATSSATPATQAQA